MKQKIVIFGTGGHAARDFYTLRKDYEVMWFFDNNKEGGTFQSKEIKKPDSNNIYKYFIAVSTSESFYAEIAEQLKRYGLMELKDFCLGSALGKKTVLLHGNCHMDILKQYMMTSDIFQKEYFIYPLPPIHKLKKKIDDDLLQNCNVFIHQDIRKENSFGYYFSDDYIVPRLGKMCKNIVVPNVVNFGKAFFPQMTINKNNPQYPGSDYGMFPFGDKNVDRLVEEGNCEIDKILAVIGGAFYTSEYVKQKFHEYVGEMFEREKNWDVKIMHYILKNYGLKKLFYDFRHPCNDIIREICIGVFKILNLDARDIGEVKETLGKYEQAVYPCVIQALHLQWGNENLRENGFKLSDEIMDFKEYYREYLYWSFGM